MGPVEIYLRRPLRLFFRKDKVRQTYHTEMFLFFFLFVFPTFGEMCLWRVYSSMLAQSRSVSAWLLPNSVVQVCQLRKSVV